MLRWESWGTTAFATGFGVAIKFQQRNQVTVLRHRTPLSSRVEKDVILVKLRQGTQVFSRGATRESDLPSCC